MTRKDYIIVAEIVIKQYKDLSQITEHIRIDDLVYPAIRQLSHTYPNFNPTRFDEYVRAEIAKWKTNP